MRAAIAALLSVVSVLAHAGETRPHVCAFDGSAFDWPVASADPDPSVAGLWRKITGRFGLPPKQFEFRSAPVNGAVAFWGDKNSQAVYYDPKILAKMSTGSTDWVAAGILAHELGHHQVGHFHSAGKPRIVLEREADEFSGFALFQMKAGIDDVTAAPDSIKNPLGSDDYDPPPERAAAFLIGWYSAKAIRDEDLEVSVPSNEQQKQAPLPITDRWVKELKSSKASVVSRVVLNQETSADTYLLSNDTVVSITEGGSAAIVGRRVPAYFPGFAWMYQSSTGLYGVTLNGDLVKPAIDGKLAKLGYITSK